MGPLDVFLREAGCQNRQQSPPRGAHGRARGHRTAMMVGARSAAKTVAVLREIAECHALLAGCDYTLRLGAAWTRATGVYVPPGLRTGGL